MRKEKKPYQMTREEFIKWNTLPFGDRKYKFGLHDVHKEFIKDAICAGRYISQKVLKDYPELMGDK